MTNGKLLDNIGLVLEGGGFRGMYTAGVLDAFLQKELYFKYVIGVSAGADYGVSYVSRQLGRNLAVNEYVSDPNYCSWFHWLSRGEYFNDDFVYRYLPDHLVPFNFEAFSTSGVTMKVGLTNCATGTADFKTLDASNKDRFATLLAATSSLPVIAKPKKIDDACYMDGGIADSIPLQKAFNDGNKRLVVILTRDSEYRKEQMKFHSFWKRHYRQYPLLAEAIINRASNYNQTLDVIEQLEKEERIYVIRPNNTLPVSRMENKPKRLEKVYHMGLEQMIHETDRLKEWIGL